MTSTLTFLSIILLITLCYLMGKYNRSDSLFWTLVISLFAGMAGGAIFSKCQKTYYDEENSLNLTQAYNPTQVLPADSIDLCALLGETGAVEQKPVGQDEEIPAIGSKTRDAAPSESSEEIRGQPQELNPLNKGTPGMPFDTS